MSAKDDARAYWDWKTKLYEWEPPEGIAKIRAIAVADAMTISTNYGRSCYHSDVNLAKSLDVSRTTLRRYKEALISAGWFTPTGKRKGETGRIAELAISVPGEAFVTNGLDRLKQTTEPDKKVDGKPKQWKCAACGGIATVSSRDPDSVVCQSCEMIGPLPGIEKGTFAGFTRL